MVFQVFQALKIDQRQTCDSEERCGSKSDKTGILQNFQRTKIERAYSLENLFDCCLDRGLGKLKLFKACSVYVAVLVAAQSQSFERTRQRGFCQPSDDNLLVSYL